MSDSVKVAGSGYEAFVLSNMSTMATLESSLRSLTWFLPGRFKDAELASEARQFIPRASSPTSFFSPVAASLNLVSMYHDTLLAKVVQRDPKYRPLIPSSLHTRFTRAWSDKNNRYKWAARALELIRFTELVLEMGLRRKVSPRTRWRSVVLLEIIKCVFLGGVVFLSPMTLSSELSFASCFCVSRDGPCCPHLSLNATSIPRPYLNLPTNLPPPLLHRLSPLPLQRHPHIYKTTVYHYLLTHCSPLLPFTQRIHPRRIIFFQRHLQRRL
jgi:hypothetical protein